MVRRNNSGADYYFDYKHVRVICVDAYSDLGTEGCLNDMGIKWVQDAIDSAPNSIRHIFISMHEPSFPRARHLTDCFNACPAERDKFWNMLVARVQRVRAVFVGHTHVYYRMRVKDPASECANNVGTASKTKVNGCLPDDPGGVYQIDCGGAARKNFESPTVPISFVCRKCTGPNIPNCQSSCISFNPAWTAKLSLPWREPGSEAVTILIQAIN